MTCHFRPHEPAVNPEALVRSGEDCAIFDLDGTILAGDSTGLWILHRLRRSPLRLFATVGVGLVALPLLVFPGCRKFAGSMLLWTASIGLDAASLRASFIAFAASLGWRQGAIDALRYHQASGDRIVVVTAAPLELAQALVARLGIPATVLGSRLRRWHGGWILDDHCRNRRKCSALAEAGYGDRWSFAYTDSLDDLPLLDGARQSFLVNPDSRKLHFLRRRRPAMSAVRWRTTCLLNHGVI